ncbi:MAG: zinc ribbon domain-containing protein [Blastocatellia bacterium]
MSESGGNYYLTEHDVVRTMPGEIEEVRERLSEALGQIGFRVLSETPLQARRTGTESGAAGCSNDILDYPTTLSLGLKSAGAHATRVTFDYVIWNPIGHLTKGDRNTLTREAEAVIALANVRGSAQQCGSCGAELGGARFCRQCGAPAAASTPAELDLFHLTAKTNVAYKWTAWGTVFALLALVLPAILFFLDQDAPRFAKRVRVISILTGTFGLTGILMLFRGIWWMSRLLNQRIEREGLMMPARRAADAPDTASLPAAAASPAAISSVTEATTDLLQSKVNRSR